MNREFPRILGVAFALAALAPGLAAQDTSGRVFLNTPETVCIFEYNGFPGLADGTAIPNGTVVPDLSGNGLNATVEANPTGDLTVNAGDPNFDSPPGANRECRRTAYITGGARVAVNNDKDAFEMEPGDDFSIELYVNREQALDAGDWGILAGTWHSRNLIDDSVGNPDGNGAWYGYGLIRNRTAAGLLTGGWGWVLSPVVDGVPRIGFASGPEQFLQPWFEIPDGRHYVVLSVDRVNQVAIGYVDGTEACRYINIDPTWAFTTPPGRDHARFLMFTGENDSTLGTYMPSSQGTHLDAVRVQRKALTAGEVNDAWNNIQIGLPWPAETEMEAILILPGEAIVDQCVLLDGSTSSPGPGLTITKYEWKIGDGPFEQGNPTREVAFADPSPPEGTEVTLRITNSASQVTMVSKKITVKPQACTARIAVSLEGKPLPGKEAIVPVGSVLSLDGTSSSSIVPPDAFICPISSAQQVPALSIVDYAWDLDGNGTVDAHGETVDTPALNAVKEFAISLTVENEAGLKSTASLGVKVSDAKGNSLVFNDTSDTIFHVELNDLDLGPAPDGSIYPDTASGLELAVVNPSGADMEVQDGAAHFADNRALAYVGGGAGPRAVVQEDFDIFEMDETESFTFELYVRPGEADVPQWGDVAGTFRARSMDPDPENQPRYGWGIIKSHLDRPELNLQGYMWFLCYGSGGAAEYKVPFELEKGVFTYVACVVDRATQISTVYINGAPAGQMALQPDWTFVTPPGMQHAKFFLFTREQKDNEFSNCVPNTAIDAVRLQLTVLSASDVATNWANIREGLGADYVLPPNPPKNLTAAAGDGKVDLSWDAPDAGPPFSGYSVSRDGTKIADLPASQRAYADVGRANGTRYCYVVAATSGSVKSADSNEACATPEPLGVKFRRGDSNDDGKVDLSDAIVTLSYLFQGGTEPTCHDAADADDSGVLDLTDGIFPLTWLFQGGPEPPAPGPKDCGLDTTPQKPGQKPFPACVSTKCP